MERADERAIQQAVAPWDHPASSKRGWGPQNTEIGKTKPIY
jgi:hypothetical protein